MESPDIPSPKGIAALPVARQRGGAITKEERTNAFWARKDSNFTWATAFARGCRAICVTMQQEQFKRAFHRHSNIQVHLVTHMTIHTRVVLSEEHLP